MGLWHWHQECCTAPAHARSFCPWEFCSTASSFCILHSFILHFPSRGALRRHSNSPQGTPEHITLHWAVPALGSRDGAAIPVKNHEPNVLLPGVQEPRVVPDHVQGQEEPC